MNPKGVVIIPGPYSVKETMDHLETFLKQHGATIYARIDQQVELKSVGQHISPLEFLLFGNPKAGGAIMAANPLTALDLPLKIIAWEDAQQKVWLAYNDGLYIEERYSLSHDPHSPLHIGNLISMALNK